MSTAPLRYVCVHMYLYACLVSLTKVVDIFYIKSVQQIQFCFCHFIQQ